MAATGAFAVGAGVFALLAQDAKRDFEHELGVFPNSKSRYRRRAHHAQDATPPSPTSCCGATVGGRRVHAVLRALQRWQQRGQRRGEEQTRRPPSVGFTPTLGGVAAVGSF